MKPLNKIDVYLEAGEKKTFAGAVGWPGWCRSGRGEDAALQALFDYGPRYESALRLEGINFEAPSGLSALRVTERVEGTRTTDYGAPDIAPTADARPVGAAELNRFQAILKACWRAFDVAVAGADGQELTRGPRGGGRDLEGIVRHVLGADAAYLRKLGWKFKVEEQGNSQEELRRTRQAILEAIVASTQGEIPATGPRGGRRWTLRYFVRRVSWHVLDHAWEIEDRAK